MGESPGASGPEAAGPRGGALIRSLTCGREGAGLGSRHQCFRVVVSCQGRRRVSRGFDPCSGKTPWRREWQPILVVLPGESNGQGSLVGHSPWGRKE